MTGPADSDRAPGLRSRSWLRFVQGPDAKLLEELYVPGLSLADRYDRCCAYFASSVLAAAARGFGEFIRRLLALPNRPTMPVIRLLVNEELAPDDLAALTQRRDTSGLEQVLLKRLKTPIELCERQRFEMLAWLVKEGLLEVRVGVMRQGHGILHAKYGIMTDAAGDAIVFAGSGNESASGLRANKEQLEVSPSWKDPDRHKHYVSTFEALWNGDDADVETVALPDAVRKKLIKLAPVEPPLTDAPPTSDLDRQRVLMRLRFALETPFTATGASACDATALVDLWPHQQRVVKATAEAWPEGRLLCDEVGMGKTIEAICVLRRLLAGRGVRRVLLLVPRGLLKQWQDELLEKGGLVVPRLEGQDKLILPGSKEQRIQGLDEALTRPILLMSRETARTEANRQRLLQAPAWDLILLDEAHAARRREQEEGEFNKASLLLTLLRELQLHEKAGSVLLLSATPMQTHPWEPWDLLTTLGEGGRWLAEFAVVRRYYEGLQAVSDGTIDMGTAQWMSQLVAGDAIFPQPPIDGFNWRNPGELADKLAYANPKDRTILACWLRSGSPLGRRMHRNTRETLRQYFRQGLLDREPPRRDVKDVVYEFEDKRERQVYNAVQRYIDSRFELLEREKSGKGFVMTVYRRRASSSPHALAQSLGRRAAGLTAVVKKHSYESFETDDGFDVLDLDELGDESMERVSAALPTDPKAAEAELREIDDVVRELRALRGVDSKRDRVTKIVKEVVEEGRSVLLFTQYADTLEYLRDHLVELYGKNVGCYSGRGGELWTGEAWRAVSKEQITDALRLKDLKVLVCTDAASEGLNLQTASALINYDLPWNPSRVEQRIGRIDRIGQRESKILIRNMFLRDSVDEQVYRALRLRCGLFERFVGPMQPVLSRARMMLAGRAPADPHELERVAAQQADDTLAHQSFMESEFIQSANEPASVTRAQLVEILRSLNGVEGLTVEETSPGVLRIRHSGRTLKLRLAFSPAALDAMPDALPLTPLSTELCELPRLLERAGEHLPLVIVVQEIEGFRRAAVSWIQQDDRATEVTNLADLDSRIAAWDGKLVPAEQIVKVRRDLEWKARTDAEAAAREAEQRHKKALERQLEAARERLRAELGRFLACLSGGTSKLNEHFHQGMMGSGGTKERLVACFTRLDRAYPKWNDLLDELREYFANLPENRRQVVITGSSLDAALADPRFAASRDNAETSS